MDKVKAPGIPWCSVLLVTLACTAHVCVFTGNLKTASAIDKIGHSTNGWSSVALDLARSLHHELEKDMTDLTALLTDAINHTLIVQTLLDTVLALAGNTTDSIMNSNAAKAVSLLQEVRHGTAQQPGQAPVQPLGLAAAVMQGINKVLDSIMEQAEVAMKMLMIKMKPALEKVGQFMIKFGDEVKTVIQEFTVTMDKVQKIFDSIMANVGPGVDDDVQASLHHHTFTLFDISNTGKITSEDLKMVSVKSGMPALQGNKSDDMVAKYDQDGNGGLDMDEFKLFASDPDLPNAMPQVLRTYARRLSEVAGTIAGAEFRDEVAEAVVKYLEMVYIKNKTKVAWVSEALTNGGLPIEFTADILAQLALEDDKTEPYVGEYLVPKMLEQNSNTTRKALNLLANSTYWVAEGFNPEDQAECLKDLRSWMPENVALLEVQQTTATAGKHDLQDLMDDANIFREKTRKVLELQALSRDSVHNKLFESTSAQSMLMHLLGGSMAGGDPNGEAEQATKKGARAKPETLKFAKELADNETLTAQQFQQLCFDATGQSSNALDSFATQMRGMLDKMQGFLDTMMGYATPTGIQQLEDQLLNFTKSATGDLMAVVKHEVNERFAPYNVTLDTTLQGTLHNATKMLYNQMGHLLGSKLGEAMEGPVEQILAGSIGKESADMLSKQLGDLIGEKVSNFTNDALEKKLDAMMTEFITDTIQKALSVVNIKDSKLQIDGGNSFLEREAVSLDSAGLLQKANSFKGRSQFDFDQVSGVWNEVAAKLKTLSNALPQARKLLRNAKTEVLHLASNLDSLFEVLGEKGNSIFENTGHKWRHVWGMYFCLVMLLTLLTLFYAFWAEGWFGGPSPTTAESAEPPAAGCLQTCWTSCTFWISETHDTNLGFWSFLIFLQLIALVIFIIATALCVLASVKVFVSSSCGNIFFLVDFQVCGQTLGSLQNMLKSFLEGYTQSLPATCMTEHLTTCHMISGDMATSSVLTVSASMLASILYFQVLIESALMHSRAVLRRKLAKMEVQ